MKLSAPIFRLKRQAKLLARNESIPLHEAQDRVARAEGFQRWSQLAALHADESRGSELLAALEPGELVLLAGKREHGKTLLAFELMAAAMAAGRSAAYFSLDEDAPVIERRLDDIGADPQRTARLFRYDTSEDIAGSFIADACGDAEPGTVIVVDYLQILDQQRQKPPLADQLDELGRFARSSGAVIVLLAQIDRSFDAKAKPTPDLTDVRMPNPIDLASFGKACFIHEGEITVNAAA